MNVIDQVHDKVKAKALREIAANISDNVDESLWVQETSDRGLSNLLDSIFNQVLDNIGYEL